MSLLSRLKTDDSITFDTDRVGGNFKSLETDLYDLTIKFAYLSTSNGGAMALNLEAETQDAVKFTQQFWIVSGDAKGNKNTFTDKEGKQQYLPDFVSANSLALLSVGEGLSDLELEEKTINLYDYDLKKEAPTKVQMFTQLIGQTVKATIVQILEDKKTKNDAGVYVANGETRTVNKIDKFLRERDSMTVTEITAEAEEALHAVKWLEKNQGQVFDKTTKKPGTFGSPSAPAAATGAVKPKSLFA
jgi:hypothetical protein